MSRVVLIMITITSITTMGQAQNWQHVVSLDSRAGYSTNSYLNPFLSEWDSSVESSYNLTSATSQSYWYNSGHSISLTGGLAYEPLFSQNESWKGALGIISYNYRLVRNFSIGVEGGTTYFTGPYNRTLAWVQPKITWFASSFTLLRFKAGSNLRSYESHSEQLDGTSRFDLYGLEFETWPSYQWRLSAGLYGSMDVLPSIQEGFNARTRADYYFKNGASLGLKIGLEQYQTEIQQQDGGGGPPSGFSPNQPTTTTTVNTDRILRLGLNSSYPISKRFSAFASGELLGFQAETTGERTTDYEISGGLRYSFEPKLRKNNAAVTPEWEQMGDNRQIRVRYSGEGRLFLVGDFNNWDKDGIALRKQSENTYVAELELSPGAYEYKILLVRGDTEEWLQFSDETYTVSDGFESENAMLLVE